MLIHTNDQLENFYLKCQKHKIIAVDTEFYRVDTYYPFLCLIQLANNEETDFIFENTGLLQKMTFALNNFFDNVIVNVEDEDIKKNRKILICKFHKNLEDRYSFSSLEI